MQVKSWGFASSVRGCAIASLVALALIILPSLLSAQTVTGTILGNVLDSSGAAVANAQITITNQDTGVVRGAASTGDGIYNVPSLQPGKYSVEAKAPGFSPAQVKDVVVNVGSNTRVDLTLQLGQVTQQVTVSEAIPAIETTSSEVAQVMDEQIIQNIPLNARDLQQLSVIQPGVQQTYTSSFGKQVSVGGDRVANNRFLQEGIDLTWTFRTSPVSLASNILMGADAVKEFKVIAENPPVEYGELSGGITSTTFKSGTNSIHGTVFEYYRNSGVDARNFFDATTTPPPLHRHQFGGQVGGPIQKDKTFYFGDFEALRSDAAQSFTAPVPDLAARNSAVPAIQQIFFGATPTSGIGTNLPLMPACNDGAYNKATVGLCNFNSNPIQSVREYYGVAKIDHSFGSKNTLSSSYNIDQSNEYEPTQLDVTADDVYMRRQVWTAQDTHILSTNLVNTFRFGIHRINYAGSLDIATSAPIDPRLYVNVNPNIVSRSSFPQVPALTFGFGGQALGSPALGFNYVPRFIGYTNGSLSDDVNYLHGNHAFQFGFQAKKWYDNIENYMSTPRGAYTFGTLAQFLNGGPATAFAWWVQNYTDPLNGQHYDSNFARGVRLMSYGVYAEDTYKVKSNLTVTYGLRWEYATSPAEEHNRISNLYAQDGSCNPFTCAAPQVGAPWYHPPKDNFAPRVGFNWDPFKKGKTSVRGGAGIMFAEMEDDYWYPTLASQPPFTVAVALPNQVSIPFNNVNGTSNSALNTFLAANPNIYTRETYGGAEFPNFKTPTKYAFNLAIQQELPDHISLSIGYVGSQARHQGRTYNYSDYFPTTIETPGQLPAVNGVPIPNSVVNPNCITPGSIECYYWVGSGASNANVLPTTTPNYATLYAPYAYACQGGAIKPPCYNNPNWSNAVGGNITDGNASYNALQAVLMRRMSPGLFARFNYTFAKCIADSGDNLPGQYTNGGSAAFPLIFSHSAGRGRCAYLGTNSANFTLTYDVPWGRASQSMLVKDLLANWEITTQTLVSSGVPFTVSAGDDVARYTTVGGAGADRPDWAAPSAACPNPNPTGAINKHNPVNYVNQACFSLAPGGYLGDVGPLVFTGPNTINTDISLRKTIPMKREGMSFVVSADMFNAFNRTNFSAPTVLNAFTTSGAANATLGAINTNNPYATVTTSRQFQINGRFVF
jgi:carboxypeptidase family protein